MNRLQLLKINCHVTETWPCFSPRLPGSGLHRSHWGRKSHSEVRIPGLILERWSRNSGWAQESVFCMDFQWFWCRWLRSALREKSRGRRGGCHPRCFVGLPHLPESTSPPSDEPDLACRENKGTCEIHPFQLSIGSLACIPRTWSPHGLGSQSPVHLSNESPHTADCVHGSSSPWWKLHGAPHVSNVPDGEAVQGTVGNLLQSPLHTPFLIAIQKISHDINIKNKVFFRELNTEHLCGSLCVYVWACVCVCGWIGRRAFSHHCFRVQSNEKKRQVLYIDDKYDIKTFFYKKELLPFYRRELTIIILIRERSSLYFVLFSSILCRTGILNIFCAVTLSCLVKTCSQNSL